MNKADELLKKVLPLCESTLIKEQSVRNQIYFMEVIEETANYLNRSEKLVAGSEWVCDVECYATNGNQTYRIGKNKVLAITFFKEDSYNVYFDFYDDVLDVSYLKNTNIFKFDEVKTSCVIPTEQFLACFSPKDELII